MSMKYKTLVLDAQFRMNVQSWRNKQAFVSMYKAGTGINPVAIHKIIYTSLITLMYIDYVNYINSVKIS